MTYQTGVTKKAGSRFKFIGDIIAELKKVVWLRPREAAYLTGLVLLASIIAGLFLGGFDLGFSQLINKLFAGG